MDKQYTNLSSNLITWPETILLLLKKFHLNRSARSKVKEHTVLLVIFYWPSQWNLTKPPHVRWAHSAFSAYFYWPSQWNLTKPLHVRWAHSAFSAFLLAVTVKSYQIASRQVSTQYIQCYSTGRHSEILTKSLLIRYAVTDVFYNMGAFAKVCVCGQAGLNQ